MQGPRLFLSTLSLRRATCQYPRLFPLRSISIHALLAESDGGDAAAGDCTAISIHALLAESDATAAVLTLEINQFLSTLSLRRATGAATNTRARHLNFYPRSPCGERRNNSNNELVCTVFLSTLSLRRATCNNCIFCFCHKISIHALLAESDHISETRSKRTNRFLSTLSLRRATYTIPETLVPRQFLSTLSLRRATRTL